jgi:hypothetical protein
MAPYALVPVLAHLYPAQALDSPLHTKAALRLLYFNILSFHVAVMNAIGCRQFGEAQLFQGSAVF